MTQEQADYVTEAMELLGTGYGVPETPEGFISPNYTQSPNDFYDHYLRRIDTLAELKVVSAFIRFTFGFHRESFKMGIDDLAEYTGLSRNSVTAGAEAAEARKLLKRSNPNTNKKAEWEMCIKDRPSKSEEVAPQSLRVSPSKFEGLSRVKERINKPLKIKEAAKPKQPPPPEVLLFREVKGKYPHKATWELVTEKIHEVEKRLLRPVAREDLRPFYVAWTSKGYNPENLAWLDWAVSGVVPVNGKVANVNEMPRGVAVAQAWLAKKEAVNG